MDSDNKNIIPALSGSESWQDIANSLAEQMVQGDLPDQVIDATSMMLAGWPTTKIAKKLGVANDSVRQWLTRYPLMSQVVQQGREMLAKWRMAQLEQQFLTAVERSQEILEVPLDGVMEDETKVNPKVLTVVAAQARYIIGLFAGQQVNINVTHELGNSVLKAKQDALDYLISGLEQQRKGAEDEPVEAVYRVVDARLDNAAPMFDENGEPCYGQIGMLDTNEEGTLCHICGKRYAAFQKHVLVKHGMPVGDYEGIFLLEEGSVSGATKNDVI